MCLPFVAASIGQLRRDWASGDGDHAKAILLATIACTILVGVVAAGSVAGYAMLIPVLVLSVLLARKPKASGRAPIASPAIVVGATLAAVVLVVFSPIIDGLGVTSFDNSEMSRLGIWQVSGKILSDHWLAGTGPGSFADVYRLYENPDAVTATYANHAHNDYLEAMIEYGLPGALIVIVSVALILTLFVRVWTQQQIENRRLKRAASTALLIVLLHSLVDYPVRTPAIACLFATCFAILILSSDDKSKRRPIRKKRPDVFSSEDNRRLII
ncbi:O-antigen ligase family protein [Henriciella algicola]